MTVRRIIYGCFHALQYLNKVFWGHFFFFCKVKNVMIICNKTERELSCLWVPARDISELVQNIVEKRLLKFMDIFMHYNILKSFLGAFFLFILLSQTKM